MSTGTQSRATGASRVAQAHGRPLLWVRFVGEDGDELEQDGGRVVEWEQVRMER